MAPAAPAPAVAAAPAPVVPAPPASPTPVSIADGAPAFAAPLLRRLAAPDIRNASLLPLTVTLGGIALVTSSAWVYERRRRLALEPQDSVLWAHVQPKPSAQHITGSLDDIFPEGPDPAESARAIYVTALGETNSRREATLIDLHQLQRKLTRRVQRGDTVAAVLLLQQHLTDIRYTSPWVFLELFELYRKLERESEWEAARDVFKTRYGQNAPAWGAPSSAGAQLIDDAHLRGELLQQWPHRVTRMWIVRWMLGEHEMRLRACGPPLLPLGVYRDLMLLDDLLDDVMVGTRTEPQPLTA